MEEETSGNHQSVHSSLYKDIWVWEQWPTQWLTDTWAVLLAGVKMPSGKIVGILHKTGSSLLHHTFVGPFLAPPFCFQLQHWVNSRDSVTETNPQMVILWDWNTNQMFVRFLHSFWEGLTCWMHNVSGTSFPYCLFKTAASQLFQIQNPFSDQCRTFLCISSFGIG